MVSPSPPVRMARDIAAQFDSLPDDEAVAAIVGHLRTFWAPSLRADLVAAGHATPEALDDRLRAVARQLEPTADD